MNYQLKYYKYKNKYLELKNSLILMKLYQLVHIMYIILLMYMKLRKHIKELLMILV